MKFTDAYILARTKRKTRRIRMAVVVVVSSLLFAVLFGVAFVAQGIINAGGQVADVGFNSRNLTTVWKAGGEKDFDFAAQTEAIEEAMVSELKARKIQVDELTKQDPSFQFEQSRRFSRAITDHETAKQKETEKAVYNLGNPTELYHFSPLPLTQFVKYQPEPDDDPLAEEIQKAVVSGEGAQYFGSSGSDSLDFYSVESGMLRTQVHPGQTLGWQPGKPYPLVISYNYLEKLGGTSLANLPAAERNAGYRKLTSQFAGQELAYCYRNSTAQDQLRSVLTYNKTAAEDKDASTKPLDVPVCGGFDQALLKKLKIITDDDPTGKKPLFPLPKTPAPDTAVIKFKVAGFVPATPEFGSRDVIADMLVGISSLPTGPNPGIVPAEVVQKDPRLQAALGDEGGGFFGFSFANLFVDFASKADQKAFLDKGCAGDECTSGGGFSMTPFGNIATALESFFSFVAKALFIAATVVVVIAGLMTMLTISKVIADSTKEIAVFRSLGARRRDIAQIYYTYGMMLAGSSLLFAVILAIAGAWLATHFFGERIAQGFVQATGAYNTDVQVALLGINPMWLLGIVGALVVASTIGIAIPVLASLRRKLINILREE